VPRTADERRRDRSLLAAALRWMSDYETWVAATLGQEYRRRCLGLAAQYEGMTW
jgi:hypothetical protein